MYDDCTYSSRGGGNPDHMYSLFGLVCGALEAEELSRGALVAVGLVRGHAGVDLGVENDASGADLQIGLSCKREHEPCRWPCQSMMRELALLPSDMDVLEVNKQIRGRRNTPDVSLTFSAVPELLARLVCREGEEAVGARTVLARLSGLCKGDICLRYFKACML